MPVGDPQADQRYDIILVDPYHDYACSLRDLEAAFGLVEPAAYLVVHDASRQIVPWRRPNISTANGAA